MSDKSQTTAELIAEALFEDTRQGHPGCMTWAEMKAHHGPEYEGVARFYSRANAALNALASAGYLIVKPTWAAAPNAAPSREAPVWPPK